MPDAEARVAAVLAAHGLHDRIRGFAETTRSAADAAQAIGCPVAAIAKSIVLRVPGNHTANDRTANDTTTGDRAVVAIASGASRVDEAKVAALIGGAVGKADARFVREATGFAIGGVSPLALPDTVIVLIDEALFGFAEIWAAAGTPFTVFRTSADELLRLTAARRAAIATQPPR
jgi:prolyl-tRNA editing enzyme YbaK/EbsC (Cys-tRNA(Pro) deacylase)